MNCHNKGSNMLVPPANTLKIQNYSPIYYKSADKDLMIYHMDPADQAGVSDRLTV